MALPYVKINFANGAIGGSEPMDDGVTLMILGGSGDDLDVQNLTDYRRQIGNATESPEVVAFYNEAAGNARLIVSHCELTDVALKNKLSEYNGDIRTLVINGVAAAATINLLQNVAEWSAETLFAPVLVLVGATAALIEDTANFKTLEKNRVSVVDCVADADGTALLYYVAGRLAVSPVQRSAGRVKDGALYATAFKTAGGDLVDNIYAEPRHTKGLVTARTYTGKAGFYISDDLMATPATDDYALTPRRRTIDKAYRIAYQTLVNYINDEIPVTSGGGIPSDTCKNIENSVERAIYAQMTVNGNLGIDSNNPSDTGVTCYIDPSQDVVSTSRLNVTIKVKPYGYAKYIEVNLGFSTEA